MFLFTIVMFMFLFLTGSDSVLHGESVETVCGPSDHQQHPTDPHKGIIPSGLFSSRPSPPKSG